MNKRNYLPRYLSYIVLAASLVFIINNSLLQGYLQNEAGLDYELWTKGQHLSNWDISNHAPYKYRVLFKVVVSGSHTLFFSDEDNTAFYYTYIFWSLVFFILAAIAFFYFLKEINFSRNLSLLGALMFVTAPPVMLAYSQPSHTREDPLAYFLLCLGLLAIIRQKYLPLLIICVAGVFCRETLLIIPFVYLFFTRESLIKRMSIAVIPFAIWVGLRYYLGLQKYELLEMGLFYNLENYIQSIYFIGITFYVLWVPFLFGLFSKNKLKYQDEKVNLLKRSAPWVFLIVMATTIVGGKLSETRLVYLLFPWVITAVLVHIRSFMPQIFQVIRNKKYQLFSGITFIIFLIIGVIVLNTVTFPVSKYQVPYQVWTGITFLYLYLTTITVPIFYGILKHIYSESKEGSALKCS